MAAAAIEFQGVSKVYKRIFSEERVDALSDVSFEAAPGEVCAFLGPNGAGKTTSIGILMGFFFADAGEIRVLGHAPGDVRAKAQIGFLPENFSFYKYLTAPKLLRLHLALAGRKADGAQGLIAELLAKVKLAGYEGLKVGKYSRGMVQRLGIAQALLCDPQLIVLDEPTSGLDPAGRREVLELLAALKARGKTVFLSSHILPEVEQICDRVVIINRGKLVRAGRLNDMLTGGDRVAIVVDRLSPWLEQALAQRGAAIEQNARGVSVTVGVGLKRETVETLWAAGCDVVSMHPLRDSLEDLFLKEVDPRRGTA